MRDSRAHEKNGQVVPSVPTRQPSVLAVHRFAAGLTQNELAQRARVTRETVGALEAGKHQPRRLTAESIGAALGVDPEDLFTMDDNGRAGSTAEVSTTAGQGRDDLRV